MTALYKPRPERWPQVSLRGLFVLLTVLSVPLGWLGVQLTWIRDRHQALQWIRHHHGSYGFYGTPPADFEPLWANDQGPLTLAPWSIRILGEEGIGQIYLQHVDDSVQVKLLGLHELFPEASLN